MTDTTDTSAPVRLDPQQPAPNYVAAVLDRLYAGDLLENSPAPELLRLYALVALVKGRGATLRDVHDARAVYVNMRTADANLLPYEQLPAQLADGTYLRAGLAAIHHAAHDECRCGNHADAVHHYGDPAYCTAGLNGREREPS